MFPVFTWSGESTDKKGFLFTAVSFFLGWWGCPLGAPIYSRALRTNLKGGKDVTNEVMDVMDVIDGYLLFKETNSVREL